MPPFNRDHVRLKAQHEVGALTTCRSTHSALFRRTKPAWQPVQQPPSSSVLWGRVAIDGQQGCLVPEAAQGAGVGRAEVVEGVNN